MKKKTELKKKAPSKKKIAPKKKIVTKKKKAVVAVAGKKKSKLEIRKSPFARDGKLDAQGLALLAAEAAFDKKGFDVMVLDVKGLSPIADMMVIVSGRSTTHVKAISDSIEKELINKGVKASKRERGAVRDATWILLDFFDVLVHVLVHEERAEYKLESLYSEAKIIAEFHG